MTATQVVFDNDGGVDKFVGDEIVAFFFPLMPGDGTRNRRVKAATAILRATGHGDPRGPVAPVGAGVGSGMAWVGAIGDAQHTDCHRARRQREHHGAAGGGSRPGEVLVTVEAAAAAGLDPRSGPSNST